MLSCVRLFVTRWTAEHQASLSLTISWSFPKFTFIALVMLSSHLILWRPLLLLPLGGGNSRSSAHWRRKWQTTPVHMLWEPHELYTRPRKLGWVKSRAPPPPSPFHLLHETYSSFLFSTPRSRAPYQHCFPFASHSMFNLSTSSVGFTFKSGYYSAAPSFLPSLLLLMPPSKPPTSPGQTAAGTSWPVCLIWPPPLWSWSLLSGHIALSSRCKWDHVISPVLLPEASLAVVSTPSPLGQLVRFSG